MIQSPQRVQRETPQKLPESKFFFPKGNYQEDSNPSDVRPRRHPGPDAVHLPAKQAVNQAVSLETPSSFYRIADFRDVCYKLS